MAVESRLPWADVGPGEARALDIAISESYASREIRIPVFVRRGRADGPTLAITAAVHGDEINGVGAIRELIGAPPFDVVAGTLVLVPVVAMPGFERHSRYLPDRRDLNRCFPGSAEGSLARRLARAVFDQIIRHSDYGIDLHSAAVRRTNFPNVRADMSIPAVAEFARAFGAELIVNSRGPIGSLRRAATKAGCITIILEAGEVWKVEPAVVEYALRGIRNCMCAIGMVTGRPTKPAYRVETDATKWIRAEYGGFLRFHVGPGDIVGKEQAIATNSSLIGDEQNVILAPRDGIVLGMTTLPSVAPGDPVCHLAYPKRGVLRKVEIAVERLNVDSLHERVRGDLATNMLVTPRENTNEEANP